MFLVLLDIPRSSYSKHGIILGNIANAIPIYNWLFPYNFLPRLRLHVHAIPALYVGPTPRMIETF